MSSADLNVIREERGAFLSELPVTQPEAAYPPLEIRVAGRPVSVELEDIEWIEAADYYVQIHVQERTYLHRRSLARLEGDLPEELFIRIHRNALVNLKAVASLRWRGRRDLVAVLRSGLEIKVARARVSRVTRLIEAHLSESKASPRPELNSQPAGHH